MKNLFPTFLLIFLFGNIYSQKSAKDYFNAGIIDQDLVQVISDFSNAIKLKPDYKEAYYYRAIAYLNNKDYAKSLNDINTLLQLDSLKAKYYNLKGKVFLNLQDGYINALPCFTKAIELNPGFAEAYYERGKLKNRLENKIKPTRGCNDLRKAKELGYKVPDIEFINCSGK